MFTKKQIPYLPAIGWFFLLLYFICMPPSSIPPVETWINKFYPDKWVHAILFGVLVFLFTYPLKKTNHTPKQKNNTALKILIAALVWGITTECIQKYFIPGRFFDWYDWLADSFGAFCGYVYGKKLITKSLHPKSE
jgi:CDP-diglyceride synthetase